MKKVIFGGALLIGGCILLSTRMLDNASHNDFADSLTYAGFALSIIGFIMGCVGLFGKK